MRITSLLVLVALVAGCGDDFTPAEHIDVIVTPKPDAGPLECEPRTGVYRLRMAEVSISCGGETRELDAIMNGLPTNIGGYPCQDIGSVPGDCVDEIKLLCFPPDMGISTSVLGKVTWSKDGPWGTGDLQVSSPACAGYYGVSWTKVTSPS